MLLDYNKGLYKDYEETVEKLDNVLRELTTIRKEHKQEIRKLKTQLSKEYKKEKEELKITIEELTKELKKANELIEKLKEENDRLKNQNNKNSSNSGKPTSTDIVRPKKSGANLYNYRIKSDKKVGGQLGHKGHNLSKKQVEEMISKGQIEVKEIEHIIKGNPKKKQKIKYKLGIKIKPYVEKHIFRYEENSEEELPESFYTDVTYDNSIKALIIELGTYNVISYERLSDFFNILTNGTIRMSNGTLVNCLYEFSNKSKITIKQLEEEILNNKNINTDDTSVKFDKRTIYVRNYSTPSIVIYKTNRHKNHNAIKEDGILTRFTGGIMGDHDTKLYSYGTKNYECNIHLGRYLEELIQNVDNISWAKKMKELIFKMNEDRKKAISEGKNSFNCEEINKYKNKYDDLIKEGYIELNNIKSKFYKEKTNALLNRLKKYKENHLYFIEDFEVMFDNNLSERDLRVFKRKLKISGCFRSMLGAEHYANALSIIKTSIKRGINPFETINKIFNYEVAFI